MDEIHNSETISELGIDCLEKLKRLVDALEQSEDSDNHLLAEDACGRLRVWAANIGALLPPSSPKSLDSRVKNAGRMKSSIVSGLDRIGRSCSTALEIIMGNVPNRNENIVFLDFESESETDELRELLLNLEAAVTLLFDLSMLLRRQRPRGRVRSFSVGFQPETASPDITNVGDKFPKTKDVPWLLQRLGNAVTLRRLRIQHRQNYHSSLSQEPTTDGEEAAASKATTFVEGEIPPEASYASSAFSAATSLVSCYNSEHGGRHVPELTRLTYKGIKLEYNKSFECPFCYTIQKVADQWEWKKHVFWDLQPYVCTFEDCVQSNDLFDSRESWFDHEMKTHYRLWSCLFCSSNLHSVEDFQRHLNNSHPGKVTQNQFTMISEACERPKTEFDEYSCPFCSSWTPDDPQSTNIKAFSRHVARHLQQISLDALPIYIEGLEIEDAPKFPRKTPEEQQFKSEEIAEFRDSMPEKQGRKAEDPQSKANTSKDYADRNKSKVTKQNTARRKHIIAVWTCCQCGQGPLPIRSESCEGCKTPRCAYCNVHRIAEKAHHTS